MQSWSSAGHLLAAVPPTTDSDFKARLGVLTMRRVSVPYQASLWDVSLSLWQEWEQPLCLPPQHTPRAGAALPPLFTESWLMTSKGRRWPVGWRSGLSGEGDLLGPSTYTTCSLHWRALHRPTSHSETGSHSPFSACPSSRTSGNRGRTKVGFVHPWLIFWVEYFII